MRELQPSAEGTTAPNPYYPSMWQLQQLFDSSLDVICSFDKEGNFLHVSAASLAVWGYSPQELIGRNCCDLVLEEDRALTADVGERIRGGQNLTSFENRYRHRNGPVVPMQWSARWDAREGVMYCIGRDASEKKTAEALREQHQKELSGILDRIDEGFYALDRHFTITYWNRQAEAIIGHRREEVLGKCLWDLYPGARNTLFQTNSVKALEKQVSMQFEIFFEPLANWFEVSVHPSEDGLSVFFRNISERKRIEQERARYEATLTEQHNRLVGVLERITEGFLVLDEEGRVVYWNREAEAITGVPRSALLGKTLWEAYPYAGIAGYQPWYESLKEKREPEHRELFSPISHRYLEFNVYPSEKDFSIFFRDISDRKKAEEELRRLSLVARETVNAVVLTDSERRVVWVNSAFSRLTGYSFEEALGRPSSELFDGPGTDAATVQYAQECFAALKPFHIEVLNYKKNGDPYWADVSCQPILDEEGHLQQFFSIATDITERKRLQEVLNEELRQRQHKITAATIKAQEQERALVGQELHDNVNQVLTTVKLYTELCLSGIGNAGELMQKSVRLLQESINEIRSLSKRLSAPLLGNIRLKESVKELAGVVAATNRLRIDVDTRGIDKLDVDQEVHLAVYRILQEHLTNVLKHSGAAGLRLVFSVQDDALLLQATDDGKGFDTRQKRSGIGITNMITRAESLGGTLTLHSQPGRGCTLLARFPLVPHKEEGWVM